MPEQPPPPDGHRILTTRGGTDRTTYEVSDGDQVTEVINLEDVYPDNEPRPIRYGRLLAKSGSLTYHEAMQALAELGGDEADIWMEATGPGGLARQILAGGPVIEGGGLPLERTWSFVITAQRVMWIARGRFEGLRLAPEKFGSAVVDDLGVVVVELANGPRFYFVPVHGQQPPLLRPPLYARASGDTLSVGTQE